MPVGISATISKRQVPVRRSTRSAPPSTKSDQGQAGSRLPEGNAVLKNAFAGVHGQLKGLLSTKGSALQCIPM
jgi:hypothetical protein